MGDVSNSGFCAVRLGQDAVACRRVAELGVPSLWNSCPQASAFPCHPIAVWLVARAQRRGLGAGADPAEVAPAGWCSLRGWQCVRPAFRCLLCRPRSDSVIQQGTGSTGARPPLSWGENLSSASSLPESKAEGAGIRLTKALEVTGSRAGVLLAAKEDVPEVPVAFGVGVVCPQWLG